MDVTRVLLVEPRGFCAGVRTAVEALAWVVALERSPVYCLHEIVHNNWIAERFRRLGVVFVDDLAEVPEGAAMVLSAHGTAPTTAAAASRRARLVVDAVCPLVTKVHREIEQRSRAGYTVIYAGRAGHDESAGAMGIAPKATRIVADATEAAQVTDGLDDRRPLAFVSQTTMVIEDVDRIERAVRDRRPDVWAPAKSDLCYATTNRQRAVQHTAGQVDAFVVVGSASSSNTASLVRSAMAAGCAEVHRVDSPDELPDRLSGTVAVTAGASAPETAVEAVVHRLAPRLGVRTIRMQREDERFALPHELRRRIAAELAAGTLPEPLAELARRGSSSMTADDLLDAVERIVPR